MLFHHQSISHILAFFPTFFRFCSHCLVNEFECTKGASPKETPSQIYSEFIVKRRVPSKRSASTDQQHQHQQQQKLHNRLSLGGTSAYAGHLSSLVFGKIKSLWTAQTTDHAGLNQLATTGTTIINCDCFFL